MSKHFWRNDLIQPALDHDVKAAIADQHAILADDPTDASAHFALGTLTHFTGDTEKAIQHFEQAIQLDPTYGEAHASLGRIYAVRGDYELAWKHARAAEQGGDRSVVELLERYPCTPGPGKNQPG